MDSQVQAAGLPGAQAASSSDDKIWAALAHGSAVLFFIGPVVPLIMWLMQRKKSPYAAFQALQAMLYQSLGFWVWILFVPVIIVVVLSVAMVLITVMSPRSENLSLAVLGMQLAIFGGVIGSMLLYMAIGVIGAVASLMGRDFRYPFFGGRLARHLEYQGAQGGDLSDEKQDYVVTSVCHSTVVILFWGLITPIVVWLTQQQRSAFLRFQAMQAAIYQGLGLLAYFATMGLYVLGMFGFMGAAITLDQSSQSAAPAWVAAAMIPLLCLGCGVALVVPLYHLFGFLAALATLRGRDYRYPILGQILASRMQPAEAK